MAVRTPFVSGALFLVFAGMGLQQNQNRPLSSSGQGTEVIVPSRPSGPIYKGQQGEQRSEVEFAPASRRVTIKLRVEDPSGYFLPNLRPENFAVYEDGVRQKDVSVSIEHAPIVAALLVEFGGRYAELDKILSLEVPEIGKQFMNVLTPSDKVAILKYDDKVQVLRDFSSPSSELGSVLDQMSTPPFSETNLHDALLDTLHRINNMSGRRAIVLVSSGVDTFSKANSQQVIEELQRSTVPIYSIGLARRMRQEASLYGAPSPIMHIDWDAAEKDLANCARASGGRAYLLDSDVQIPAFYDDITENLRIRYVVSYVSSNPSLSDQSRKIRVALVDPRTDQPLKFRDTNGKPVTAHVFVQEAYSPNAPAS
jgi:Ca-activated chloride channel family protein